MNKAQLTKRLNESNIDPQSYSFDELFVSEQYVLVRPHDVWCVYYAERGQRSGLQEFASESAACSHFLDLLTQDKTTRLKPPHH